ncbi:MAG: cupin domain-containing protein, partial [Flavobacterium sp.]
MKPKLLKIQSPEIESFSARRDLTPTVNSIWHYHEELELVYFKKGEGTQFIGDKISRFKSGDVVLVGANLPHYWRFDQDYFEEDGKTATIYVIHFHSHFLGEKFLEIPENRELKKLISNSARGLQVNSTSLPNIVELIIKTVNTNEEGKYVMANFPANKFIVEVKAVGYQSIKEIHEASAQKRA